MTTTGVVGRGIVGLAVAREILRRRARDFLRCWVRGTPLSSKIWETGRVDAMTMLDREAIAHACDRFGVARLRIFGSAATGNFDPKRSDLDFFVDFLPEVDDLLGNYLALNEELERILGREVDLIMSDAVKNPYFAAAAFPTAKDVYAA